MEDDEIINPQSENTIVYVRTFRHPLQIFSPLVRPDPENGSLVNTQANQLEYVEENDQVPCERHHGLLSTNST